MLVLLGIGLLAGIVTAISPCVLPVLPILLAGGASGRKPLQVIAGLGASFTVFTLFATWLLDKLGLPSDLLRNLAIALLFVVAGGPPLPGGRAARGAPRAARRRARRAPARTALAAAPPGRRRRVHARSVARARLRAVRRPR